MEITVISEEENPMLHRTDVQFRVSHAEATPDRLAVRDSLAARLNKDADEVVIRRLDTKFGMRETVGEAKVYQGADFATDVEQAHMLARNKIGEAAEAVEEEAEPEEAAEDEAGEEAEAEPADDEEEPEPPADDAGEAEKEADEAEEQDADGAAEPEEGPEEPEEPAADEPAEPEEDSDAEESADGDAADEDTEE